MENKLGNLTDWTTCLDGSDSYTVECVQTHASLIQSFLESVWPIEEQEKVRDWKNWIETSWSLWDLGEIEMVYENDADCVKEAAIQEGLMAETEWSEENQEGLIALLIDYLDQMPIGEFYAYYLKLEADLYLMF